MKTSILEEAQAAVYGAREKDYGHPRDDFARIADLWTAYLRQAETTDGITSVQVAHMMVLLKLARLIETPAHRDSWVDIAGYAQTGARVMGLDE